MPQKYIELKPAEDNFSYDEMEKRIKKLFKEQIYYPILKKLKLSQKVLANNIVNSNDPYSNLKAALKAGKITYSQNKFSGTFNAQISKELKALGATWNKRTSLFTLPESKVPIELMRAISQSTAQFKMTLQAVQDVLGKLSPEEIAGQLKSEDLFGKTIDQVDRSFQESVRSITISPKLSKEAKEKIAKEWSNNMELWIQDFTRQEIKDLREDVQKSAFKGIRIDSLAEKVQKSYGVSADKAKFLARQETHLLIAKMKETRYVAAGVVEYTWRTVHRPKDKSPKQHIPGNVRYAHGILDGKIFRFDNPPVTTNPGEPVRKNNPGQDYNCLPTGSFIDFYSPVVKGFRRFYRGELTELIMDSGLTLQTTGNHPILTGRGWIAAEAIQFNDHVFASEQEGFFSKEMNRKNMKPTVEQVFDALSLCSQVRRDLLSETDFHGDIGTNQHVDIISADHELILAAITLAHKELKHFLFQSSNSTALTFSPVHPLLKACASTTTNLMCLLGEFELFSFRHTTHAKNISSTSISNGNTFLDQPIANSSPSNFPFQADSKFTHPVLVILDSLWVQGQQVVGGGSSSNNNNAHSPKLSTEDVRINADTLGNLAQTETRGLIKPFRILDKRVRGFSGHIYNFETKNNWYSSNNIICHNCRCYSIPIVRTK